MQYYFDKDEAIKRMERRSTTSIRWTLKHVTCYWSYINGAVAKNYDGSPAPNPDKKRVLQLVVVRKDQPPRFTNYW